VKVGDLFKVSEDNGVLVIQFDRHRRDAVFHLSQIVLQQQRRTVVTCYS